MFAKGVLLLLLLRLPWPVTCFAQNGVGDTEEVLSTVRRSFCFEGGETPNEKKERQRISFLQTCADGRICSVKKGPLAENCVTWGGGGFGPCNYPCGTDFCL